MKKFMRICTIIALTGTLAACSKNQTDAPLMADRSTGDKNTGLRPNVGETSSDETISASETSDDETSDDKDSAVKPDTTEPAATEPATTEPAATEPATTEPATPEPTTAHIHNYIGASCTTGGVCSCGAVGSELGHSFTEPSCTVPSTCIRCGITGSPALGHNYSQGTCIRCGAAGGPLTPAEAALFHNRLSDAQNAEALAVAKDIAAAIEAELSGADDIDKVSAAAYIVAQYCSGCAYTMEGTNYSEAYGVFIAGEYSCAGATRALGLVLSCMGYSWQHVNENQYSHQWISLTIDGQTGWADGQIGWAGYGNHPIAE